MATAMRLSATGLPWVLPFSSDEFDLKDGVKTMAAAMIFAIAFLVSVGAGLVLLALSDRPRNGRHRTRTPLAAAESSSYATEAHESLINRDAA